MTSGARQTDMGSVAPMGIGNVSERRMQPPQVGVSIVVLALDPDAEHGRLWMPLVRRIRQPFLGGWALPGGAIRADTSLAQSAYEALESTTDLHPSYLEQLHTFGDPGRSRGGLPMISVVYWAMVDSAQAKDFIEADNVRWFPEGDLGGLDLAFDHRQIIAYALERLRTRIEYPDIASHLIGETFTLRQLHSVYEAVTGSVLDLPNFRRKMLASGEIEPTGDKRREGRQRPAMLYRYVPDAGNHDAYALSGRQLARLDARVRLNARDGRSSFDAMSSLTTTD